MLNFNFVVGNPPYQKQSDGKATLMLPVYHIFMDKAYELSRNVTLITPAKYLFNAGLTPKNSTRNGLTIFILGCCGTRRTTILFSATAKLKAGWPYQTGTNLSPTGKSGYFSNTPN